MKETQVYNIKHEKIIYFENARGSLSQNTFMRLWEKYILLHRSGLENSAKIRRTFWKIAGLLANFCNVSTTLVGFHLNFDENLSEFHRIRWNFVEITKNVYNLLKFCQFPRIWPRRKKEDRFFSLTHAFQILKLSRASPRWSWPRDPPKNARYPPDSPDEVWGIVLLSARRQSISLPSSQWLMSYI